MESGERSGHSGSGFLKLIVQLAYPVIIAFNCSSRISVKIIAILHQSQKEAW